MHSIGQIVAATFLGGPMAGAWLMARNYRTLDDKSAANKALLGGLLATAALIALLAVLPEGMPNGVIPVAYTLILGQIAHKLQGPQIKAKLEGGGPKGSHWVTAGIGVLCLVCFFVSAMAILLFIPEEHIAYGDCDVYWEDGGTEDQARLVGDYMVEIDVFAPDHELDITVMQPGEAVQLEFIVNDGAWDDPGTVNSFQNVATWVSQDVFDGAPVEILMCNDFGLPRKVLRSDDFEVVEEEP